MYKKLGIIGGMGSLATYYFYKLIVDGTDAKCDQDHINMMILNDAQIPDRTKAILYGGTSPFEYLKADCEICEKAGCDIIAIPCNTAHFYHDRLQKICGIKILNMIELTANRLGNNIKNIFLLSTEGTIKTGVYKKAFDSHGINIVTPTEDEISVMMKTIYGIKANAKSTNITELNEIILKYIDIGCEKIVLGCTELSAIYDDIINNGIEKKYVIDALRVMCNEILLLFRKI